VFSFCASGSMLAVDLTIIVELFTELGGSTTMIPNQPYVHQVKWEIKIKN